jgi:peptidyl-prolyl cis-trans isomerase B (cyclophilin B)
MRPNCITGRITPHLDGQYTVFGEVEEGLDVVEMIQGTATGRGDRPLDDIEMRIVVIPLA